MKTIAVILLAAVGLFLIAMKSVLLMLVVQYVLLYRMLPWYLNWRYERLHRAAGGIKYPECPCWGCDTRHSLAAHGFKTTREAISWKRAIRTRFYYTWHDTPLRPVSGCSCEQCLKLLRAERIEAARLRDEREAIEIVASPPPKQEWMAGGWS